MEKVEDAQLVKGETKLFGYFRSSSSWRVRIALNFKKEKYDTVGIHLLKEDQKSDAYKKHNPSGLVPALWIDGVMLNESIPILEYLEETRPDVNPLLPKSPLEKQQVRRLCEHINGNMQPLQNLRVLVKVNTDFGADKIAWAKYWNEVGLESLDKMLETTAGTYAFGNNVTLADICIFPQAAGAFARFGIAKENYPTLSKVMDNLKDLPEFEAAMPQNQPDFEAPAPPK